MGARGADGFETQDPHQGSQEAGPIAQHESTLRGMFGLDEGRKYRIRIEENGQGWLVWDGEREALAAGGGDELVRHLVQREPAWARSGRALRMSFDAAVQNGTDLIFDPQDGSVRPADKEEDQ
jgi:hypothetical protein